MLIFIVIQSFFHALHAFHFFILSSPFFCSHNFGSHNFWQSQFFVYIFQILSSDIFRWQSYEWDSPSFFIYFFLKYCESYDFLKISKNIAVFWNCRQLNRLGNDLLNKIAHFPWRMMKVLEVYSFSRRNSASRRRFFSFKENSINLALWSPLNSNY